LGPGQYRHSCRDAVANPDAESYANSNSYTFCMRAGVTNTHGHCDSNGNTYSHSYCDSYGYGYSDGHGHSDTYGNRYTDCEASANTEGSSHAAASPIAEKVTGLPAVAFAEAGD
jgi:hypothetical protein